MTSLRGHDRKEFPQKIRKQAFARCCKNGTMPGIPQCENCGNQLRAGNIQYEHLDPDGLGGEPTLDNCGVWCANPCSKQKDKIDNPRMAKADAVLKKSYGLEANRKPIQSAGFRKTKPQRTATRPIEKWTGLTIRQGER